MTPWELKLCDEALLLDGLGLLDRKGRIRCGECGRVVARNDGWHLDLCCACGWRLYDFEMTG